MFSSLQNCLPEVYLGTCVKNQSITVYIIKTSTFYVLLLDEVTVVNGANYPQGWSLTVCSKLYWRIPSLEFFQKKMNWTSGGTNCKTVFHFEQKKTYLA
jgi:hypothetical protein